MLSKWQIWDFFSSYDRTTLRNFEGVLIINTFDSLCLKLLKDFLFKGAPERVIHHKTAAEVNLKWIESEFQTLSLFPNDDNFFIHHSQDIASDLLDTILNLDLSNRFIILNFENEGVTWKKVLKNDGYSILQIESPRHWEFNKLLDFTCAHLRLPLGHEAKSWILDSLENNFQTFYDACCLLKLNHPDAKEVSVKEVRELLTIERLDQFLFASLFARKKFKDFYEKVRFSSIYSFEYCYFSIVTWKRVCLRMIF